MRWVGITLFAFAAVGAINAETLYVDGAAGDDFLFNGRCEIWDGADCGPFESIQWAIYHASDGDEIVVMDGTYTGVWNRNIDYGPVSAPCAWGIVPRVIGSWPVCLR